MGVKWSRREWRDWRCDSGMACNLVKNMTTAKITADDYYTELAQAA